MRLSEVESEIKKNNLLIVEINKQLSAVKSRNEYLEMYKEGLIINHFSDYIELNQEFEIDNHCIRGIMVGDNSNIDFEKGDKIEIVKKNKKSFLVKVDKQVYYWNSNTGARLVESKKLEGLCRIQIMDLYRYLTHPFLKTKYLDFKTKFDTYIRRKESIDIIIK